ncbi:hypothetical protein K466DRAFT_655951 [Polyporus arcularius HHB13444]|uniref:Uncharacterized protein n=1 Tax=Polyporus arcularius HHB13444 TaxID=1314778 RepID=A0A5C3NWZ9_9APHY|nr:hypothetical protein K466DRAFT_655951 [Polyporus arcularius HHB13444]
MAQPQQHFPLYLPHQLFQAILATNPPPGLPPGAMLPFTYGIANATPTLTETRLTALTRHPFESTKPASITNIAAEIMDIPVGARLRVVMRCKDLNRRLRLYTDPGAGVVPHGNLTQEELDLYEDVYGTAWPGGNRGLTTAGPPATSHEYPRDAHTLYQAMSGLAGWFIFHRNRPPALVHSEPAVQDEVERQLFTPIELILRTRYRPSISVDLNTGNFLAPDVKAQPPIVGDEQVAQLGANPPGTLHFAPQFGRPTHATHGQRGGNAQAGFPDFLLFMGNALLRTVNPGLSTQPARGAVRHGYNLCGEVKTSWSYEDRDLKNILSSKTAKAGTGDFLPWIPNTKPRKIVFQIWGEMYFFQCNWGFVTNGSSMMFFVKLDTNTLVFGEPMDWRDKDLMQTMVGLCFASVDEVKRGPRLRAWMCAGREANWE